MINPENIHCLALNYKGVGDELQVPLYFVKSKSSLCFEGVEIEYPSNSAKLWTEVELTVVISKDCSNIEEEDALEYIEGFIVGADITCSNIHSRDHHLAFSKSRKNYCPVSKEIKMMQLNNDTKLITEINGKITQKGSIFEMRYNPFQSLSFVSKITTLKKGDILLTGTPQGVENNILSSGDRIRQVIENIGELNYGIR